MLECRIISMRILGDAYIHTSYSLNSLKRGYIKDYIGKYYRDY